MASPKRNRGVRIDGNRLRKLMTSRGRLTTEQCAKDLDKVAEKEKPWSDRTVAKALKGGPVDRTTWKALAALFAVDPATLLEQSQQQVPSGLIEDADKLDRDRKFSQAVSLGRFIVDNTHRFAQHYTLSRIKLAIYLDHAGRQQDALNLLNKDIFQLNVSEEEAGPEYWWAHYQEGVIASRLARSRVSQSGDFLAPRVTQLLEQAQQSLSFVLRESRDAGLGVSAEHHLNILENLGWSATASCLKQGARRFRKCLEKRQELEGPVGPRLCYEYRGMLCSRARLGAGVKELLNYACLAIDNANAHQNERYKQRIEETCLDYDVPTASL